MYQYHWIASLSLVTVLVGCGGSKDPAAVADQDEIAAYAAEHPEAAVTYEEGEDL